MFLIGALKPLQHGKDLLGKFTVPRAVAHQPAPEIVGGGAITGQDLRPHQDIVFGIQHCLRILDMGVFLSDAPAMDAPAHLHQAVVSSSGDRVVACRGLLDDHGGDDERILLELFAGLKDIVRILRRGLLTQLGIIAPQQGGDTFFLGFPMFFEPRYLGRGIMRIP